MQNQYYQCLECGMIERAEWPEEKHVCGKITDKKFRIMQDMTLRIGKKRFIKIKVLKNVI